MTDQKENNMKKILSWKLPWVLTDEEIKAKQQKSAFWYVLMIPYRLLKWPGGDSWIVNRKIAFLPVAIVALLIIALLYKLGILPLYK